MKTRLIAQAGPGAGQIYTLDAQRQPQFSMGRSAECDIVVRDRRASRHHCDIRWNGRQWEVVDRGSTNGTRVNGVAVRQPVAIRPGDTIGVGETTLVLQQETVPPGAPPAAAARPGPLQPVPVYAAPREAGGSASARVEVAFWIVQGLVAVAVVSLAAGSFLPWFRVTGSLSGDMESLIRGLSDIVSSFIGEDLLSVTQEVSALSGYGVLALGLAVLGAVMLIIDIFLRRRWIVAALVYILPTVAVCAVMVADLKSLYDLYEQVQSMSLLFGVQLVDVVEAFGKFIEVEVTLLPGLYLTGVGLGLLLTGGIARLVVALMARGR
ncbi:MAG: FHA domain-containing protein [Anaerolineae bacterium]|jgi:type III secretory pathway component EscS